jgi:hypothetical protein
MDSVRVALGWQRDMPTIILDEGEEVDFILLLLAFSRE